MENVKNAIPIVMAADENYACPLLVSISSLLRNAGPDTAYDLYLLIHGDFSEQSREKIRRLCLSDGNGSPCFIDMMDSFSDTPLHIAHTSPPTYFRLRLPSLLPEINKCIYLDADILVLKDLAELYATEMGDCCLAGVRAPAYYSFPNRKAREFQIRRLGIPDTDCYVNAGVLLMDLRKMREQGLEKQFQGALGNGYSSQDQDILNVVCYGQILTLPFKFNVMTKYPLTCEGVWEREEGLQEAVAKEEWDEGRNDPVIIHYAGAVKPWDDASLPLAGYWWQEFLRTDERSAGGMLNRYLVSPRGTRRRLARTAKITLRCAGGEGSRSLLVESPVAFTEQRQGSGQKMQKSCWAAKSPLDFTLRSNVRETVTVRITGSYEFNYSPDGAYYPYWIFFRSFRVNGKELLEEPVLCSASKPCKLTMTCDEGAEYRIHAEWEEAGPGINTALERNETLRNDIQKLERQKKTDEKKLSQLRSDLLEKTLPPIWYTMAGSRAGRALCGLFRVYHKVTRVFRHKRLSDKTAGIRTAAGGMLRKTLIVHNPAIGTDNLGDEIIMEYCDRVLARCFPRHRYRRIDVPTHMPVDRRYEAAMKKADYQVVCGTNILCPHVEKYNLWKMEGGAERAAYHDLILLACGWNHYSPDISEESRRLYGSMLSRDHCHSVRDGYTKQRMEEMGFRNVLNTGCVTFWDIPGETIARIPAEKSSAAVFTLTAHRQDPQRDRFMIETLLENYRSVFFWPQGDRDLDYFRSLMPETEPDCNRIRVLERSLQAFEELLERGGTDYVGTRLHGGCHALNMGARTLVVAVDNRAAEIGKDTGLPVIPREQIERLPEHINAPLHVSLNIRAEDIRAWKDQF